MWTAVLMIRMVPVDGEEERERRLSVLSQRSQSKVLSTEQELELHADEEIVDIAVTERRRSIVMKKPTEGDLAIKVGLLAWVDPCL